MQSLNVLLRTITVQPLLNGPPLGNEEWPKGGWPLIGGKHNRKALNGTLITRRLIGVRPYLQMHQSFYKSVKMTLRLPKRIPHP